MYNSDSDEWKELLQILATSNDPAEQQKCVEKLGQWPVSNREIVRALLTAELRDSSPAVQLAAMHALISPYHKQTILENPDLLQEAKASAAIVSPQLQDTKEQKSIAEFERRRVLERSYYFAFIGTMVILCGFLYMLELYKYSLIVIIILSGIFLWLSWKNWRCPNCNVWFDNSGSYVNTFFSSQPLYCPKCKNRLL